MNGFYAPKANITIPHATTGANLVLPFAIELDYQGREQATVLVRGVKFHGGQNFPAATFKVHLFGRALSAAETPSTTVGLAIPASLIGSYGGSVDVPVAAVGGRKYGAKWLDTPEQMFIDCGEQPTRPESYDTRLGALIETTASLVTTQVSRGTLTVFVEGRV